METIATPLMQQWHACKKKAGDALLFFRLGDFYEAFYEDAKILSKELSLTLTHRQDAPMCGVPFHAVDHHIDKLISKGFKVAIAEQMEEAQKGKALVRRDIVRIITPGTIVESRLLSEKNNNFFLSLSQIGNIFGLALIDLTTAEFRVLEVEGKKDLMTEALRFKPSEWIVSKKFTQNDPEFFPELSFAFPFLLNTKEEFHFDLQMSTDTLLSHFQLQTLDGLGLRGMNAAIEAAGALISHLSEELHLNLSHIKHLQVEKTSAYMSLDYSCMKNLELFESFSSDKKNTLIHFLDETSTPMGGRKLRQWLHAPLLSVEEITQRQDAIEELLAHPNLLTSVTSLLDPIKDLERLIMKICSHMESPRDMTALCTSLEVIPTLKNQLSSFSCPFLRQKEENLVDLSSLTEQIKKTLVDLPPLRLSEGDVIREGANPSLDDLRRVSRDSRSWIASYQNQLRVETSIKNLKVGFTKIFGYFIEVSRGQTDKIPPTFQRRQTLTSAERYCTEELKTFEQKILSAEEKSLALESALYNELRQTVAKYSEDIYRTASAVALIDTVSSLALVAKKHHYVRPHIDESSILYIKNGRHPIIENSLPSEKFIPNDTLMDGEKNQLFLITGPNMAGKSTYIRQVALIVILAQIGSFVPAEEVHMGIIDKLFSRIGATDDIAKGQSTFMVEMTETANILNNATSKSLVLLDEVGRGTSTYDGISIAWAVAEYLLTTQGKRAKTLFATHYWELTHLEEKITGAVNYNVAVEETPSGIVFLRKIVRGGTDKSYGLHVAKLAGLPFLALKKAEEMLSSLEKGANRQKKIKSEEQLPLFSPERLFLLELREALKHIDLNHLSPMQAHQKLLELQQKVSQL